MQIRTLPVYSKLASDVAPELAKKLPAGWQLSQHQAETYRALTQGDTDIIFNTAMTGDGKSLAGQLPSLVAGWRRPLFAMYPTNELIRDQRRQAERTWHLWEQFPDTITELNSKVLDNMMESRDFQQRGEALLSLMRNHDVVLTNPDIFHYIMQQFYIRQGSKGDASDRIIGPMVDRYQQFTFDEFHVFDTPQVVSVLNAILLIHAMTGNHRRQFLFQSATPNRLMVEYLERAGLSYTMIGGKYHHSWTPPDLTQWRHILHGSIITFEEGTVENWLDRHLEDTLLPFFRENRPAAKGAIIVNSVAQAKRLVVRLRAALAPHGLQVGENTGFTGHRQRRESYGCDLLVGTSTVDVGVDFEINFLLFESRDAGTFLQRLGRLGRHDGYVREGESITFKTFQAHAVLPRWILEVLFERKAGSAPLLIDGEEVNREELSLTIEKAFPPVTDFPHYAQIWGGLQSARVILELSRYVVRGQYQEIRNRLATQYQATFGINLNRKLKQWKELQKNERVLLDEVTSFRGGSYFTCGVLDLTETGADQFKLYDLFALIANADLAELTKEDFWAGLEQAKLPLQPFKRANPIGFFRVKGFLPERTNYVIEVEHDLMAWSAERFGVAMVLQGVTIDASNVPGLNDINKRLRQMKLPALLCLGAKHPLELKRRLRLPLLFPIYPFTSQDGLQGLIAFGREALLLDVALRRAGIDCGGGAVIC